MKAVDLTPDNHTLDDLLNQTFKLFVDFVPFRGWQVAIPYNG